MHDSRGPGVVMRTARVILAGMALAVLPVSVAHAGEPYGGCDEAWQAPTSPGAQDCRDLGWVVRPRIGIDPHGLVRWSMLPTCTARTVRLCTTNITGRDDSTTGYASWRTGDGVRHYVWPGPFVGRTWVWVTSAQADTLAESGVPHADRRAWEKCAYASRYRVVRCADGLAVRY